MSTKINYFKVYILITLKSMISGLVGLIAIQIFFILFGLMIVGNENVGTFNNTLSIMIVVFFIIIMIQTTTLAKYGILNGRSRGSIIMESYLSAVVISFLIAILVAITSLLDPLLSNISGLSYHSGSSQQYFIASMIISAVALFHAFLFSRLNKLGMKIYVIGLPLTLIFIIPRIEIGLFNKPAYYYTVSFLKSFFNYICELSYKSGIIPEHNAIIIYLIVYLVMSLIFLLSIIGSYLVFRRAELNNRQKGLVVE